MDCDLDQVQFHVKRKVEPEFDFLNDEFDFLNDDDIEKDDESAQPRKKRRINNINAPKITSMFTIIDSIMTGISSITYNKFIDQFIIGKKIGSGAFGSIFLIKKKDNLEQTYAIKIVSDLTPHNSSTPSIFRKSLTSSDLFGTFSEVIIQIAMNRLHIKNVCTHFPRIYSVYRTFDNLKGLIPDQKNESIGKFMMIMENINGGYTFEDFIIGMGKTNLNNKQTDDDEKLQFFMSSLRIIFIQLLYSLYCLQEWHQFTHHDLHTKNIIVRKMNHHHDPMYYVHDGLVFSLPKSSPNIQIIDFGFSRAENIFDPETLDFYTKKYSSINTGIISKYKLNKETKRLVLHSIPVSRDYTHVIHDATVPDYMERVLKTNYHPMFESYRENYKFVNHLDLGRVISGIFEMTEFISILHNHEKLYSQSKNETIRNEYDQMFDFFSKAMTHFRWPNHIDKIRESIRANKIFNTGTPRLNDKQDPSFILNLLKHSFFETYRSPFPKHIVKSFSGSQIFQQRPSSLGLENFGLSPM